MEDCAEIAASPPAKKPAGYKIKRRLSTGETIETEIPWEQICFGCKEKIRRGENILPVNIGFFGGICPCCGENHP
jgi:rRNA maturation endonuclease Nob1